MIQFGSIRISDPLSGKPILGIDLGMGLGRLVRVSSLWPILPDLKKERKIRMVIKYKRLNGNTVLKVDSKSGY